MRIIILFTLLCSNSYAEIEATWQRQQKEMELLKKQAFLPKLEAIETVSNVLEPQDEKASESLSLRRKPKMATKSEDPNVLPLESQYFDNVKFEMSAPEKPASDNKKKTKQFYKIDGSLPVINRDLQEAEEPREDEF
jgi:hypothetical protein